MEEVNQNLPPENQRSKVPTRAPHQKLPKFSFPLRKKAIFFQTPRKYLKDQRRRRSDPLRNDVQGPPQKISSIGEVWILNGMALSLYKVRRFEERTKLFSEAFRIK